MTDAVPGAMRDKRGNFGGLEPRECGEHWGTHRLRAWCFDCQEWCYQRVPCSGCKIAQLKGEGWVSCASLPKEYYLVVETAEGYEVFTKNDRWAS